MTAISHEARRKGLALALLSMAQFMVVLDFSIVNVALPSMQRDLGFSTQNLQWVISAYSLTLGGLLLLGGRLGDIYGRRFLFMLGLIFFSVASLAGGFAPSGFWLIGARAVQGLGAALVAPTSISLISTTFAEGNDRNKAFGVVGSVASAGFAAGAILGGILTSTLGWRWVMFVNVPIGILAVVVTPLLLRENRVQSGNRRVDVAGAFTVTAGLVALVYALSQGNDTGWLSLQTLVLLVLAVILLTAFVLIETRIPSPLVRLNIFRLRSVTGANLVTLLAPGVFGSLVFILTLYMQKVLGYSAISAGLAFLPLAAIILVASNVVARLVIRVGLKPFLVGGLCVFVVGLLLLTQITANGDYLSAILPGLVVASLGMGPVFATMIIAATDGVSDSEQGLASGLFNTSQQIGSGLVLAIVVAVSSARTTAVLQSGGGTGKIAVTAGLQAAFYVCAGIAALAAVVAAVAIQRRKGPAGPQDGALEEKSDGDRAVTH